MKLFIVLTTFGVYDDFYDVRAYSDKTIAEEFVKQTMVENVDTDLKCQILEKELIKGE